MVESLPTMVDKYIKEQVEKQVPEQAEVSSQIQQAIDNNIPSQVDASMKFETLQNSAKRQKTSEYEAYMTRESSGQVNESEQSPSSSGN
ncbi:hypothetical protein Tco_0159666 [Tanacetum coccineum]